MSSVHFTVFLFFLFGIATAKAIPQRVGRDVSTTTSAAAANPTICGDIIDEVDDGYIVFYASDAYQCLTSVPFNDAVATRFIEYYNTTMQFQSTTAYVKDPPEGYQQPAVDFFQELDQIQRNTTVGYYKNQYAFEAALQSLIYSVHDTHVDLNAGVLSAFSFASPYYITSASVDGKHEPRVYITDDVLISQQQGWKPSPIVSINGEDIIEFLTQFAKLNSVGMLEPHADWNQLMASPAQDIQGALNVFAGGATFYPGDDLVFTFENGTDLETFWLAIYNNPDDTGPLTTGGDFYNYFVLGLLPDSYNASLSDNGSSEDDNSTDTETDDSTNLVSWYNASYGAYPNNPDVVQLGLSITGGGVLTGYFLNDTSTAVLSIPSFDVYGDNISNFSSTVNEFISRGKEAGLSKVVIDLQQNFGGTVLLAIDTFKQFFPQTEPFGGSRRRSHQLANVLGGAATDYWASLSPDDDFYDYYYYQLAADEWVVTDRLNADTGKNFSSWTEFFGPRTYNGDSFSLTECYNLSSEIFDAAAFDGWVPYGYSKENAISTSQPWNAEDIILLTDGLCSSSCSLFVEMMTRDAGVRTVVAGGRPTTGPMQAASGSRGARVYSADALDEDFAFAQGVNTTANSSLPQVRDSGIYSTYIGFNLRDQIRKDDTMPLQFKYEAASCRIYYTLANTYNMSKLWRDAAAAIWEDESLCVEGSTGYATSGNTTVAKAPPPVTIQSTDLQSLVSQVDFNVNATGGLQDGIQPRRSSDIQSCSKVNSPCGSGGTCKQVNVACSNGEKRTTLACLPTCQNRDGANACRGANTVCQNTSQQQSKLRTTSTSRASPNLKFGGNLFVGLCYPLIGSTALGCPKA